MIRDDKEGQTDNLHLRLGGRRRGGDRRARSPRPTRRDAATPSTRAAIPRRSSPAAASPTSTRRPASRHLHDSRRRTPTAPCSRSSPGCAEHKIRIISPDLGGGFGNKVPVYPGYVFATPARSSPAAGQVDRGPHRQPDLDRLRARLPHARRARARRTARSPGLRVDVLADQGAFDAAAQPTKFKAGLFHIVTGSYDIPAAHVVTGVYTNKAPGGVAYRCSFRVTEAVVPDRAPGRHARATSSSMDPAELRLQNFIQPDQFPYEYGDRLVLRLGRLRAAMDLAIEMPATTTCAGSRRRARAEGS